MPATTSVRPKTLEARWRGPSSFLLKIRPRQVIREPEVRLLKPWNLRDLLGVNNFDILFSMLNVSNRFGAWHLCSFEIVLQICQVWVATSGRWSSARQQPPSCSWPSWSSSLVAVTRRATRAPTKKTNQKATFYIFKKSVSSLVEVANEV